MKVVINGKQYDAKENQTILDVCRAKRSFKAYISANGTS